MIKVLFVCLGNICRSPTAHGVFEHKVAAMNLADKIVVDSAGTAAWHVGKLPDSRSRLAAQRRGVDLDYIRARQVTEQDFYDFDYILAMDADNLSNLEALKPQSFNGHLSLFLSLDDALTKQEVPDPYYGGEQGFEEVLDLVEQASQALIERVIEQHRL